MKKTQVLRIRERYDLSQRAFADLLAVSPATAARWELGTLAVSPKSLRLLTLLQNAPKKRVEKRSVYSWPYMASDAFKAFIWYASGVLVKPEKGRK